MRRSSRALATFVGVLYATLIVVPSASAQRAPRFERERVNGREAVAREVLIKFRNAPLISDLVDVMAQTDAQSIERIGTTGTLRLRSRSQAAAALIAALSRRFDVVYAEPNHIIQIAAPPDDSRFSDLWGMQAISAPAAWDLSSGANSNVVVGVIDTGIDYNHPDLAANIWSAPAAFTVTLSSGAVSCAAGTHGFNAITRQCDPMDDHNHGTHVSGTIGAVGNNGVGVAGVNWTTHIMGIKFLDSQGSGTIADAIEAVEFAIAVKQVFQATDQANIRVLSNSWGGSEGSQALLDQINAANDAEMLFVAAAGNNGTNNDVQPLFPAAYSAPNIVAVAATSMDDSLTWFSNYGATSVHLAAPGDAILSTTIGNTYSVFSGTSMATPHVSGAAALVLSMCQLDTAILKDTLLGSVDYRPALAATTITGGRLNVNSALHACTAPPDNPSSLTATPGNARVTLTWPSVLGALRYDVKRSLTSGGPYTEIASDVKAGTYVDNAVTNDTTYYYVIAAENTLGASGDSNEASATPMVPSDLQISVFTVPAVGGAGSTIALTLTTSNTAIGMAPPSITRLYLSVDTTLDASDTVLADVAVPALAPGATASASPSVAIPDATTVGRYSLLAAADADGKVVETSESNNRVSRSIQIGPDLTITTVNVSPSTAGAGAAISVTDGARNAGGGTAAATTTVFYLSVNTSFSPDDILLGSRAVPALTAGVTDTGVTTVTIPASTVAGVYNVVAVSDIGNVVLETTETNNSTHRQIVIGGDLIVSSFTTPASGAAGSTIVVTDTTKNTGSGTIGATTTRFYLSPNATLDATDTLLPEGRAIPALEAGATHTGSTTLTLPAPLAPGSYYVVAKADGDSSVAEVNESNNNYPRQMPIGSDLVVSAFTAPALAAPGSAISVTDTTTNQGAGAAASSTTRFYLSSNAILDTSDTLLAGVRIVGDLSGGAASSGMSSLTLPAALGSGTYYLFAHADGEKVIVESNEANNTMSRSIQIGGDIVLSALTVPAKGGAGLPLTVTETTANQGSAAVGASVTRFYLSVNGSVDSSDILIGSRDVPALASGAVSTVTTTMVLPSDIATKAYSLIARADSDGGVVETNEGNNTYLRTVTIGSDLVISVPGLALKAAAGMSIDVGDTVTNQGGGLSTPSITRYYLSTNTTLSADDILLGGGREVDALSPSGTSAGTTAVWLPTSAPPGVFYLIGKADGDNGVAEISESNNTENRAVVIGPDLIVSSASVPASGVAGSTIAIADTVTNQGGDGAAPTTTRFYLSTNASLDAADIALVTGRAVPPVAAGASSGGTTLATIPPSTSPGFYYLILKADGDNAAGESSELNNVVVRTLSVTAAP